MPTFDEFERRLMMTDPDKQPEFQKLLAKNDVLEAIESLLTPNALELGPKTWRSKKVDLTRDLGVRSDKIFNGDAEILGKFLVSKYAKEDFESQYKWRKEEWKNDLQEQFGVDLTGVSEERVKAALKQLYERAVKAATSASSQMDELCPAFAELNTIAKDRGSYISRPWPEDIDTIITTAQREVDAAKKQNDQTMTRAATTAFHGAPARQPTVGGTRTFDLFDRGGGFSSIADMTRGLG